MRRSELDAVVAELREAAFSEFNKCHSPQDGKFCSMGGGGVTAGQARKAALNSRLGMGGIAPELGYIEKMPSYRRAYTKAFNVGEKRMAPDAFGMSTRKPGAPGRDDRFPRDAKGAYAEEYKGIKIRTLGHYTTPHYYADSSRPKMGAFNHSTRIARIRRTIDMYGGKVKKPRTDLDPKRYRVRSVGRGI